MEQVRRQTKADLPAVKSLWKARFGDSDAFLDWFFTERYLPAYSACLTCDGQLVSSALGFPMQLRIRGKSLPGLMISGVSTMEGFEHRGYMRRVMTEMMAICRDNAIPVAFHRPVNLAVYASIGHLPCTDRREAFGRAHSPATLSCTTDTPDISALTACYAEATSRYSGCVARSSADMARKWRDYASCGARCLTLADGNACTGYAILLPEKDGWDCPELLARTNRGCDMLLDQIPACVPVKLPPDAPALGALFPQNVMGAADIQTLLSLLCGNPEAVFTVSDPVVRENNGVFDGTGKPSQKSPQYRFSAGALLQRLCGYLPLDTILSREVCYCVDEY